MLLDDEETASDVARELNRRSVAVVIRSLTAREMDQVRQELAVA